MIRTLAAFVRRQAITSIFEPWKPRFSNRTCHRGVFWHGTQPRHFCCCSSKPFKPEDEAVEYPLEMNPPPTFIDERIALFEKLKAECDAQIEAKEKTPIKVTLRDGKVVDGLAWKTTPYEIAASISQGLADNTVVCKVSDSLS